MKNEGAVKQRVKGDLEDAGAWYTMPHQTGYSQYGVPDFLACVNGQFLAIETKFGYNKPTKMQEYEGDRILQAGGEWWVINERNVDGLRDRLQCLGQ